MSTKVDRKPNAEQLENWFRYHSPTQDQLPRYQAIRDAGRSFAEVICQCAPDGPDQTVAIRKVRKAVMVANQAIACEGVQ